MDANDGQLTFALVDELARASVRKRPVPPAVLATRSVVRLGPLIEMLLLERSGVLSLDALSRTSPHSLLLAAFVPGKCGAGSYASRRSDSLGFISTSRGTDDPDLNWVEFRQKAQRAAELSLPKPTAQGLVGAMTELEDNVQLHSQRAKDGIVAFRGTIDEFEFVVADSGIGILASLHRSPDYIHVVDAGRALRLALQDGESRLKHVEPGHGYGFRNLFRNLANLNGMLRFRSDDQALTIEGVGPELVEAVLSQQTMLQGFAASVVCRPYRK